MRKQKKKRIKLTWRKLCLALHFHGRSMITLLEHIGISSHFLDMAVDWSIHLRGCKGFPSKINFGVNSANSVPSFTFKGNDIRPLFDNPIEIISCSKCNLWDKKYPKIFNILENILLHYVQKIVPVVTYPDPPLDLIKQFPVNTLLFKKKGILIFGDSFGTLIDWSLWTKMEEKFPNI